MGSRAVVILLLFNNLLFNNLLLLFNNLLLLLFNNLLLLFATPGRVGKGLEVGTQASPAIVLSHENDNSGAKLLQVGDLTAADHGLGTGVHAEKHLAVSEREDKSGNWHLGGVVRALRSPPRSIVGSRKRFGHQRIDGAHCLGGDVGDVNAAALEHCSRWVPNKRR